MNLNPSASKPHYPILDGLRGVAALTVVVFHIFEAHSTSHLDLFINHGYLAVDFFFLLSGFVIGYAYDDRWERMTIGSFFKRRIERLQPMVIMGMIIGAIFYPLQASNLFPIIATIPYWKVLLVMLIGCFMIPLPPSMDIRGWRETYTLNGPAWSLFFEYVANILYALILRRLSNVVLAVLTVIAGIALVHYAVTSTTGDVIGGWSLDAEQLRVGFIRLAYPFLAGLLLFRVSKLTRIKNAFAWCSLLVLVFLAIPRVGGATHLWANGLYDSLTIILIFPLIIYMGASGELVSNSSKKICKFLGDISYPIYITHYPLIYLYTAWVVDHKLSFSQSYPQAILVFVAAVAIAYACLKWYDEPVRKWLKRKGKN